MELQQDAVARSSRELETIRNQLAKSKAEAAARMEHFAELESRVQLEQDPELRKAMEGDAKRKKAANTDYQEDAQLFVRESEIKGRQQIEQATLSELDDQLNGFERLIEAPPSKQP